MRLDGKVAIVTGAGSGIGQATAQLFAARGATVVAVDLADTAAAHEGGGSDGEIHCLDQDVSAPEAARAIVDATAQDHGRLDILVNNAGIARGAPVESFTDEDWDATLAVNLTAHFKLARAAIPHMKAAGGGRIVNVASVMADGTDFGLAAYCASKAGVAGLTRNLALELGRYGITANYVLPGAIHTGMTAGNFANEDIAKVWARKSPFNRLGQPIDVARCILFLASEEGGFVTGHGLNADGGLMLRV